MKKSWGSKFCIRFIFPALFIAAGFILITGCTSVPEKNSGTITAHELRQRQALVDDSALNDMVNYVIEHHPDVIAAEENLRSARASVKPAGSLPDPALTFGQNLKDINNQRIGVTQGIPMWGKRGLASSAAEHRALAAEARLAQTRLETVRNLKQAYAEHAYVYAVYEVSLEHQTLLKHLEEVVRVQYQTGGDGMSALLRIQGETDSQKAETERLRDLKKASAAKLNSALGIPADSHSVDPEPLPDIPRQDFNFNLPENIEVANPELAAMHHELSSLDSTRAIAARSGYPDLNLGLEAERSRAMGEDEIMIGAMAGINLPLWRGSYRGQREGAEADYQAFQYKISQRRHEIQADIQMTKYNIQKTRRDRELYDEVLTVRAEQALASVETAYRTGEAGFSELIDTRRELLAYRVAHIRALADYLIYTAELEVLTGRLMEGNND